VFATYTTITDRRVLPSSFQFETLRLDTFWATTSNQFTTRLFPAITILHKQPH